MGCELSRREPRRKNPENLTSVKADTLSEPYGGGSCGRRHGARNRRRAEKEYDMRIFGFPLIAASILLAVSAFAQTSNRTTSAQSSDMATSHAGASNLPPDTLVTLDTQQKLKQSLMQSGFQDVLVTPSSYVIHAKAPDGSHILMQVSPDRLHAIIVPATGSSSAPGGSSSSESGTNR
jgi:hypothetical protein